MLSMVIDSISSFMYSKLLGHYVNRNWCVFYDPDEISAGAAVSQRLQSGNGETG